MEHNFALILAMRALFIVSSTAVVVLAAPALFSGSEGDALIDPNACGMYLIPSTMPGAGRGVVAGLNFNVSDNLETVPTITVRANTMDASQLKNYGFGTGHPDFALIIYGPGNIYNHGDPYTVGRYWADEDEKDPTTAALSYTDFKNVLYNVRYPIVVGEEMRETYGDNWFARFAGDGKDRNVNEAPREAVRMDIADLQQYGHCLTDVRIKASDIPGVGNGLFAERDFAAGEIVTISPVLTLPRSVVDGSEKNSVLKNYCLAAPDSDLVLFPLNYGPMINHNLTQHANVYIEWYDWSPAAEALATKYRQEGDPVLDKDHNLNLSDKLKRLTNDLFNAPFAQLDIAYKASGPIRKGEQLLLNYGKEWEKSWAAYTEKVTAWETAQQQRTGAHAVKMPQFRQYLAVPDGMYPAHWMRQPDTACGMFLVPSTIPGAGRGVVAGRALRKEEKIEIVPSITVSRYAADHSQLRNYVFGTEHDDFHIIIYGPGNIYNHRKAHTMGRYGGGPDKDASKAPMPYTDYTKIMYTTLANIETGEEMYETYGDHWFLRFQQDTKHDATAARRVQQSPRDAARMNVSDLLEYGHCLTDISVEPSSLAGAGNGLFATRDFAAGEVVTISPVLSLPKKVVEDSSVDTVLMNYCFTAPNSDLALFPINYGPMINHNTADKVNVQVDWYDWSPSVAALSAKYHQAGDEEPDAGHNLKLSDKLAMSVQELFNAPFAQLDIAYRATRPIKQGEELFLDYGSDWQATWDEYCKAREVWNQEVESRTGTGASAAELAVLQDQKPKFRHFMAFPPSLYSSQWHHTTDATHDPSEL